MHEEATEHLTDRQVYSNDVKKEFTPNYRETWLENAFFWKKGGMKAV